MNSQLSAMTEFKAYLHNPPEGVLFNLDSEYTYFRGSHQYVFGQPRPAQTNSGCIYGDGSVARSGSSSSSTIKDRNQRLPAMKLTVKLVSNFKSNQEEFLSFIHKYQKFYPNEHLDVVEKGQINYKRKGIKDEFIEEAQQRHANRKEFDAKIQSYYSQLSSLENQMAKMGIRIKSNCEYECECNCDLIANRYQITYPENCQIPEDWHEYEEDYTSYAIEIQCHRETQLYNWLQNC
jgi:hypothetical protein